MRRQKIQGLYRRRIKRTGSPLYIRFPGDKPAEIRLLLDSGVVMDLAGVEARRGKLEPFSMDPKNMELEEFATFIRIVGEQLHTVLDPRDRIWDDDDPDKPDPMPTGPIVRGELRLELYRSAT